MTTLDTTPDAFTDPTQEAEAAEPMLRFFRWKHLPFPLSHVSRAFGELALSVAREIPRNAERTVALRKLLEAKDCAVRACLE